MMIVVQWMKSECKIQRWTSRQQCLERAHNHHHTHTHLYARAHREEESTRVSEFPMNVIVENFGTMWFVLICLIAVAFFYVFILILILILILSISCRSLFYLFYFYRWLFTFSYRTDCLTAVIRCIMFFTQRMRARSRVRGGRLLTQFRRCTTGKTDWNTLQQTCQRRERKIEREIETQKQQQQKQRAWEKRVVWRNIMESHTQ